MLLLAVETVVAGLLHQKVFDHALVLGLLHGPRVGLAHVHVVAGKYQVKYTHSLSLHSCYYHYRKGLKETHGRSQLFPQQDFQHSK